MYPTPDIINNKLINLLEKNGAKLSKELKPQLEASKDQDPKVDLISLSNSLAMLNAKLKDLES